MAQAWRSFARHVGYALGSFTPGGEGCGRERRAALLRLRWWRHSRRADSAAGRGLFNQGGSRADRGISRRLPSRFVFAGGVVFEWRLDLIAIIFAR